MTVSATWPKAVCRKLIHARRAQKARRVRFQAGSSTPLHLIGVELEKVDDDFGFGRVGRKAVGISPERSEHCEAMSLEGCKHGAVIFAP